ncbi:hypothetical protein [Streptomyces sp. CB02009]|uniref:hypothetical protein n=1 Tax=Streptomyces sp. CB02009 TaxID=1703938 RepID=UPI000A913B19|nr:hypothetical protein [Streptomyces sp. CB02009]
MTRLKKYALAASVVAALAGVPTAAFAFPSSSSPSPVTERPTEVDQQPTEVDQQPTDMAGVKAKGAVRMVDPGEQVSAGAGVELWLTKQGKHWSTPEGGTQFRSVRDGNAANPGLGVQQEGVNGRVFLSGTFRGTGMPGRVEVRTADKVIQGTVVTLAGEPGWGAWYADGGTGKTETLTPSHPQPDSFYESITVYDTTGKIIAQFNNRTAG